MLESADNSMLAMTSSSLLADDSMSAMVVFVGSKKKKGNKEDTRDLFLQFNLQDAKQIFKFLILFLLSSLVELRVDNVLYNPG